MAIAENTRIVSPLRWICLLGACLIASCVSRSQPVSEATGAAVGPLSLATTPGDAIGNATAVTSALLKWGRLQLTPSVNYQTEFADGLHAEPGHSASSYIRTLSPTVVCTVGDHYSVVYAPSLVWYSNPSFSDSVAQSFSANAHWSDAGWSATITQQYQKSDSILIESGRQTRQQASVTEAGIDWVAGKLSYGVSATQTLNFLQRMTDTFAWTVQPHLQCEFAKNVSVGVGVTGGYDLVYHASDVESVRPAANVAWQATNRITVDGSIGYDDRRFVSGARRNLGGTYYQYSITWTPFVHTSLTASAGKSNSTAPFQNQSSKTDTFSVALQQRLLGHFNLSLGAEEDRTDYELNTAVLETARSDTVRSYSARISTTLLRRFSVAGFYRRTEDLSSEPGFGFSSSQVGFEVGFAY